MKSLAELQAIKEKMKGSIGLREEDKNCKRIVVGMATCGIAAGARISLRAAAGRISAGRSGQNSRMVFPGYGVTVYDDSFRNDGRSRGLRFYRPSGRSRVFRPLQGFIAPRIGGDGFSGQQGARKETSSAVLSAYVVPWLLQRVTVVTRYTPSFRCRRA